MDNPKQRFLQIRLTEVDRRRVARAAEADHLDDSTWARRVILNAVDEFERRLGERSEAKNG